TPSLAASYSVSPPLTNALARGRKPDARVGRTLGAAIATPSPSSSGTGPFVISSKMAMDTSFFLLRSRDNDKKIAVLNKLGDPPVLCPSPTFQHCLRANCHNHRLCSK